MSGSIAPLLGIALTLTMESKGQTGQNVFPKSNVRKVKYENTSNYEKYPHEELQRPIKDIETEVDNNTSHMVILPVKRKKRERVFGCSKCDSRFTTKWAFKSHYRTIHEGKHGYECEECGKIFALKGTYTFHIEKAFLQREFLYV